MKRYIIVCAFVLLLSGCSSRDLCFVPDCPNRVGYKSMEYCKEHTCTTDGCYGRKSKYDDFCVDCENQKTKELMSSPDSVEIARKETIEYCELLKSKHGYIKDIIIEPNHRINSETTIVFDCKVIQTDATRPASIYVHAYHDGFKVHNLYYK